MRFQAELLFYYVFFFTFCQVQGSLCVATLNVSKPSGICPGVEMLVTLIARIDYNYQDEASRK